VNIEPYMPAISNAARVVKAALPPGHGLELADLVQIGAERVLRYLSGTDGTSYTLAFVCAKQGMFREARLWSGRCGHGTQRKTVTDPVFVEYDDERDDPIDWLKRCTSPNLEAWIDLVRALFSLNSTKAAAWYGHHVLGQSSAEIGRGIGVTASDIVQHRQDAELRVNARMRADRWAPLGPRQPEPRPLDDPQVARAAALYAQGLTFHGIAGEMGCAPSTARLLVMRSGVPLRERRPFRARPRRRMEAR
jgi:DNA-directed RNA polymerase specialized sigma24 family protein